MKLLEVKIIDSAASQLEAIAKWQGMTPEAAAKHILEEACTEIWKIRGSDIDEMMRGLEYFNKL